MPHSDSKPPTSRSEHEQAAELEIHPGARLTNLDLHPRRDCRQFTLQPVHKARDQRRPSGDDHVREQRRLQVRVDLHQGRPDQVRERLQGRVGQGGDRRCRGGLGARGDLGERSRRQQDPRAGASAARRSECAASRTSEGRCACGLKRTSGVLSRGTPRYVLYPSGNSNDRVGLLCTTLQRGRALRRQSGPLKELSAARLTCRPRLARPPRKPTPSPRA